MERINPRFVNQKTTKTGVPFWGVESMGGGKYTVWDKDIADKLISLIGSDVDVEIKQSGNFLNIRGIVDNTNTLKEVQQGERSLNGQEQKPIPTTQDDRSKSIIAQCLVKAVLGQVDSSVDISGAVNMYKQAFELL